MPMHTDAPPPEYMSTPAAAAYLDFTERTLSEWRRTGCGPRYIRVRGRSVRYSRTELDRWMREQEHASTSAESAGAAA
jgi:predicted DNA-binding transcriptional regulator AlpA